MKTSVRFVTLFVFVLFSSHLFAKPVDVNNVRKVAATMIKAESNRAEKTALRMVEKGKKQLPQELYTLADTKEIRGSDVKILAYVTELEPEGFIITSADDTISPVLGYSFKGKFPFKDSKQNVLLHLVQWDMEARLKALKSRDQAIESVIQSNNDSWDTYTSNVELPLQSMSSGSQTQWPDPDNYDGYEGWIKTNWGQGWPEQALCPLDAWNGERSDVGCTATAMAQILNYYQYPSTLSFSNSDIYDSKCFAKGDLIWKTIHIDSDSSVYDFPAFLDLDGYTIPFDNSQDNRKYLSVACGFKVKMNYSSQNGSGAFDKASAYLDGFGYGSAEQVKGWLNKTSCWNQESKEIIIQNIQQEQPVQMAIWDSLGLGELSIGRKGHSVIVDGYDSTLDLFHVNMGWYGNDTAWYSLPNITSDPSYDLIGSIVFNISRYQGWSQWGSDEKNSFSTIYSAPTAENEPITNKWYRTSDSVYSFNGLVVGTGNRIYASSIPDTEGYHPSIWVINQYGVKEKEITITEEIDGLTYPVQNSSGEIFVGADSGKVYRINPKDNSYIEIFDAGSQLYKPPKVDSDGRIYVCTEYKLYCLSRTGSKYWEFSTPDIDHFFFRKVPAIDVERGRVYIDFYNPYTDIAYLACIDRLTGLENLLCRKFVSSVTSGFNSFSTLSIGPDGTVYAGCKTTLYAYNPDTTLSQKWAQNLTYTYVTTSPSIGPDGTLYTSHWVPLGGDSYNLRIGARDASNGNLNWEYSQGASNLCDSIGDIYVSGNNVVSFWYNSDDCSSTSTHTIYALRDNGTSCTPLWNKDFGQQGGQTAFGPGATLYTISSTAAGNTIYALSDGPAGDPDGGGMGYTDNAAPAMPFNPSPIDEANDISPTVTLSWSCTDPEAHTLKYSLFVGESGYDMVPVATELTSTSYQLTGLKLGTGYAWKIIATDGQAVSEGPTWVFSTEPPSPDINGDGIVNFVDFSVLAGYWQQGCDSSNNFCEGADLYVSDFIDVNDLSILCQNWLEETQSDPTGMVWVAIDDPGVSGHEGFNGEMSKYETTNAQYCQFLNEALASGDITVVDDKVVYGANGSNSGADFVDMFYFETYDSVPTSQIVYNDVNGIFSVRTRDGYDMSNHPVVEVSWYGATAFCNYYGYRLPTEWEWQAVADYDGSYTYGCGTIMNQSKANYYDNGYANPLGLSIDPYTSPVDYYESGGRPGPYGYGMCDMAGNVWELTDSWCSTPHGNYRVLRGGGFESGEYHCEASYRFYPSRYGGYYIGFRVCRGISMNGIVAYWSFDEGSGTTLTDDSGNGHDGSINGATWVDGVSGKTLSFDGSSDYVGLPSSNDLSFASPSEAFSASFWIKSDSITPSDQTILENEDDYLISLYGGVISYRKTDSGNLYHNCWQSTNPEISAGIWSHVVVTYDGTGASGTKMYVNGAEVPVTNTAYHGGGSASGDDFAIGIRAYDFADAPYGGEIDEVRIYNRVLTSTEIEYLYQNP